MVAKKYTDDDGNSKNYRKRAQREKYRNNEEYYAKINLKYLKKKFQDNKEFEEIMNKDISITDKLLEARVFNFNLKSFKNKI